MIGASHVSRRVELVGGPLDGTVLELQSSIARYKVALPIGPPSATYEPPVPLDPVESVGYVEAVYEPGSEVDRVLGRWTWQGAPL